MEKNHKDKISKELKELVSWSVAILGEAIKKEYGLKSFQSIEKVRKEMKTLRHKGPNIVYPKLDKNLKFLQKMSSKEIHQFCNSYSLMLELINRCETAYRTYRLENKKITPPAKKPHGIIFVLTAHPTEARSPQLLGVFENVQELLVKCLKENKENYREDLYHLLFIALKITLARKSKPSVEDEACNIYSYILQDNIIDSLISFSKMDVNVSLRSWVGGDKDGHPGVNEKTLVNSLTQSRNKLVNYIEKKLIIVEKYISYMNQKQVINLTTNIEHLIQQLKYLKEIKSSDGVRIRQFKTTFLKTSELYTKLVKVESPELKAIERLMWIFPSLVVALEVREDSSLVKEAVNSDADMAITKMLKKLKDISNGFYAKWYVRGFVLSMVESSQDILNGYQLTKNVFGNYEIPVVPLFENEKALTSAKKILNETFTKKKSIIKTHIKDWGSRYEVMVGYSDSSKENGVLPSRYMISQALGKIEQELKSHKLTPVFFHGSGGSIERGGGSVKEQTGWWPKSAIHIYKATVQGEMVARNFGSSHILNKQIQVILDQLGTFKKQQKKNSSELSKFVALVRESYSKKIKDSDFLNIIESSTPYSFLHHLKIGSRPTKRAGGSIQKNLRAIPWILCWTQTRILFPTWWGVGNAWNQLSVTEKNKLKREYKQNPVLLTYVKALGFTLAKVELGVWKMYLEQSAISKDEKINTFKDFEKEFRLTKKFFTEISGEKKFLWFRPWLQESIDLRSSMIHPLNLCQLESLRRNDHELLRNSVTGIACGMLTTG